MNYQNNRVKRVLIISPYFPPVNAADMQRVRTSLPYYAEFDWEAEVVAVNCAYVDMAIDPLLCESVPAGIKIHLVKALKKKWTSKFGFGGISYRSYFFIKKKVSQLLKAKRFDLIYFSTTQFQVCTLGVYWEKKFKIPYIIDMQDPWHSDYYRNKPREERPPKYWLSYRINKYLEPVAMKNVSGLVSVSKAYIDTLITRYPTLKSIPSAVITFGGFKPDFDIAAKHAADFEQLIDPSTISVAYVGRGGTDMYNAIRPLFKAVKAGEQLYKKLHFYFIGTSYAPAGQGKATIKPLAKEYGLENQVTEITDRIGYYHTLFTLQQANALFVPGSDDPAYTASKIYPYVLASQPLLTIFNLESPANAVLLEFGLKNAYSYNETYDLQEKIGAFLQAVVEKEIEADDYDAGALEKYSARTMARRQCKLFDKVISVNRTENKGDGN